MPSTVYKGDLAEVSFAPETGMLIRGVTDANIAIVTNDNVTTLMFSAEQNTTLFETPNTAESTFSDATCDTDHESGGGDATTFGHNVRIVQKNASTLLEVGMAVSGTGIAAGSVITKVNSTTLFTVSKDTTATNNNQNLTFTTTKLRYPRNILVGSQVVWEKATSAIDDGDLPDTGNGGRIFTIVENIGQTLKISPAMKSADGHLGTADNLHILPYKTPPMDEDMEQSITAAPANERVLTDQFLGIATALTLPETKIDLKRFHVVGLGRDTAIQVPGKLTTEGGSFEVAMHSARWLKYCLGNELILSAAASTVTTALSADCYAGQSHIFLAATASIVVGSYIEILDSTNPAVPIVSDHEPDGGTWDGTLTDFEFDNAYSHEVRRVVAVAETANTVVYLDEPLTYPHGSGRVVEARNIGTGGTNPVTITDGTITNPVEHLLYSRSTLPSFSLEVSQRRRDIDSDETTTDGGVGDSKELTRVFRGCKVTDWTLTTDNDAALRLSVNYNAALCYTDTGRLEATPLTRFSATRMFDDHANTDAKRIQSGIGKGTQKPFMFYNGSIKLAGQQVAQVLSMTLTGQTGMQSFHTINGNNQSASAYADQVPFGGARNASLMVEGQTTYEMTMEIAVDDPLFYHKMRTGTQFSVGEEGDATAPNQIRIIFEKNLTGSTTAANSEKMVILIDDYYIVEAPLQIPEDKGVVKSTLKIMPKAVKVLARDSILKY